MPSIRTISNTLTAALGLVLSGGEQALAGHLKHCPINTPLSCHNTTAITNGCCTIIEGLVLSTQFWDYAPATGPSKSWTIHGTWSDFCDGTYPQFCDPDRQYTNITQILEAEGRIPLLKYMKKYWKDYQGNDESFWEHEFNKHGTCFSTLKPSCYVDYKPQQEVGQYFRTTVDLFKTLPSYEFLGDAGIIPSTTKTYSLSDVHAALTKAHGFDVTVQCDTKGALSEIWYYFNVKGSLTKGKFFPTNTTYTGNCPAVVSYLPKVPGSRPTGTPTTTGTPTSTPSPSGAPFTGRGHLNVVQAGKTNGCIISYGTWYTTGTCATFTAATSGSGFTLTSSKGLCAVDDGTKMLSCSPTITTGTIFGKDGSNLTYDGDSTFSASKIAVGSTQEKVTAGSGGSISLIVEWQSA